MIRMVYFYFKKNVPQQIAALAPEHAAYWQVQGLAHYSGGPFEDRSGGLITFSVDNLDHAQQPVRDDPFIKAGVLEQHWIKVWKTE